MPAGVAIALTVKNNSSHHRQINLSEAGSVYQATGSGSRRYDLNIVNIAFANQDTESWSAVVGAEIYALYWRSCDHNSDPVSIAATLGKCSDNFSRTMICNRAAPKTLFWLCGLTLSTQIAIWVLPEALHDNWQLYQIFRLFSVKYWVSGFYNCIMYKNKKVLS